MRRRLTPTLALVALVIGVAVAGCGGADSTSNSSGGTSTTETTVSTGTDEERGPSTPIEAEGYHGFRFTPEAWGERDPGTGDVLTGLHQASEADVAAAEGSLPAAFGASDRPEAKDVLERLDEYTRQYVGFERDGRRLVYVNAFCTDTGRDPSREIVAVLDGGDCFWQAQVDPATGAVVSLSINGVA
jgi:hypothetical protein